MSCQGTPQFSHLGNGRGVPGTKAFHCQGEKDDALPVAGFPRLVKLSLVGNRESMAVLDILECLAKKIHNRESIAVLDILECLAKKIHC